MEFIKLKRFEYKSPASSVQSGVTPRSDFKFSDKVKVTCFKFCNQDQTISIGLNNGQVAVFCNARFNQKKLTQTKDFELRTFSHIANPHKGQIRCLLNEQIFEQRYIITGSSDRTIKIWDTDPKTKDVTQTIVGHNGTIMALVYSRFNDTLFSASNDKTVRIWKQEKHREFFQHPWYICYQVISELSSKRIEHPLYATSFELRDGEKDKFVLFLGDSEGSIHQIKLKEIVDRQSKKKDVRQVFVLEKSNFNYHRLSIHKLLCVPKQNILFSLSYDQTAMGYQQMTEKQFLKMPNNRKQIFTCCAWLDGVLVLADEGGCLYFVEINTEKEVEELQKYDCRIIGMQYIKQLDELLIATESYIDSVKIKRGVKSGEGNSHTDAVVGIFSLEPYKITNKKVKDSPKLITVSLDNTMRIWDPQDLNCLSVLQNPEKGEISCLSYLEHANLFVTGHQNGAVRLWNIELGNSITIDQSQSPFKHGNSICALASYIYERGNEDITEYLFSAGYEGKINVWQIFQKKNIVQSSLMSSTICPQLKHSFFADATQKVADKIGNEILSMCVYQQGTKVQPETNRFIISAGNSGKIYFTKMFTYEHHECIEAHSDSIYSLIIDENILFSGSLDKTIKLWSLEDKSMLTTIDGSESGVRSLRIIEETGHLVNNAFSGEVFFWDYPKKVLVKKIDEKNEKIQTVTYINEFKTLFVGTQQANIYTYSISDLYEHKAILPAEHKHFLKYETTEVNEKMIEDMLRRNQQELDRHNKP